MPPPPVSYSARASERRIVARGDVSDIGWRKQIHSANLQSMTRLRPLRDRCTRGGSVWRPWPRRNPARAQAGLLLRRRDPREARSGAVTRKGRAFQQPAPDMSDHLLLAPQRSSDGGLRAAERHRDRPVAPPLFPQLPGLRDVERAAAWPAPVPARCLQPGAGGGETLVEALLLHLGEGAQEGEHDVAKRAGA